mgnify:FL=1
MIVLRKLAKPVTGGEPAGLSLFYFKEKCMLPQKKFSTFSEQVEWLQDEKHLIISDRQYAEDVLKHIGYFPLMGGYKHLFRIPLTKNIKMELLLMKLFLFMNSMRNFENCSSNIYCR